jgi:UTP--glucose-1-phosphate uridylyltransferase
LKAIIPAAGMGTRFMPLTKVQPKEMLPVLDKPCIQYVVEEALAAGCDEVRLVLSGHKQAIREHFSAQPALERFLADKGKQGYLDKVRALNQMPVSYAIQPEAGGLGQAVACGRSGIDEPFFVLLGDVLVPDHDVLDKMWQVSQAHHGASVIAVFAVEGREVERFGVIGGEAVGDSADGVWRIDQMVEKPKLEEAPSNLAIFGRYLLTPAIFSCIDRTGVGAGGEIQLTDAMLMLLEQEEMYAVLVPGKSAFDTGTVHSWLESNVRLAKRDPELAALLQRALGES